MQCLASFNNACNYDLSKSNTYFSMLYFQVTTSWVTCKHVMNSLLSNKSLANINISIQKICSFSSYENVPSKASTSLAQVFGKLFRSGRVRVVCI